MRADDGTYVLPPPPPAVPRAGRQNKNIFSPKNQLQLQGQMQINRTRQNTVIANESNVDFSMGEMRQQEHNKSKISHYSGSDINSFGLMSPPAPSNKYDKVRGTSILEETGQMTLNSVLELNENLDLP